MHSLLKLFRFIIITAIWSAVYAKAASFVFVTLWGFPLFNPKGWDMIPEEWKNGWVIDTPSEFFFFLSIFLLIPLFLVGLVIALKLDWNKCFRNIYNILLTKRRIAHRQEMDRFPEPAELAKLLLKKAKERGKQITEDKRPPKIDGVAPLARSEARAHLPKLEGETLPKEEMPTLADIAKEDKDQITSAQTLAEPKLASRLETKYKIITMAEAAGIKLVQDLKIGEDTIDFAFIVKGEIYLTNLEPIGAEWLADETGFEDEDPLWFSESKYEVSPVYRLNRAELKYTSALMEILDADEQEGINVHKLFLVSSGVILNYDDIREFWEDSEVDVYRLAGANPETIPLLDEFLASIKDKGANSKDILEKIYTAFVAVEP